MHPGAFPPPQDYSGEDATSVGDPPASLLVPMLYDDNIIFGDLAYDFLAREAGATLGSHFPGFVDSSLLAEDNQGITNCISPAPVPASHATTPNVTSGLSLFSPPPLPSSSQASPTPEPHQASPEPSSTPEPSCRQGVPTFNNIRGKWCCSVCDRDFRGKWECTRHIEGTGNKQVKCVACGGKLKAREDSLRRHLRKYCKGDLTNIQFEDAFVEL